MFLAPFRRDLGNSHTANLIKKPKNTWLTIILKSLSKIYSFNVCCFFERSCIQNKFVGYITCKWKCVHYVYLIGEKHNLPSSLFSLLLWRTWQKDKLKNVHLDKNSNLINYQVRDIQLSIWRLALWVPRHIKKRLLFIDQNKGKVVKVAPIIYKYSEK